MAKPHDEGVWIPEPLLEGGATSWGRAIQKKCWPRLGYDMNENQNLLWLATKIWELWVQVASKRIPVELPGKLEWFPLCLTKDPVCKPFLPFKLSERLLLRSLGITPRNLLTISLSVWRVTAPLDKPSWPRTKHLKETSGGQESSDSCGCTVGPHSSGRETGLDKSFIQEPNFNDFQLTEQ